MDFPLPLPLAPPLVPLLLCLLRELSRNLFVRAEPEPVLDCECEWVWAYTVCSVEETSLRMSDAMFFSPLNMVSECVVDSGCRGRSRSCPVVLELPVQQEEKAS